MISIFCSRDVSWLFQASMWRWKLSQRWARPVRLATLVSILETEIILNNIKLSRSCYISAPALSRAVSRDSNLVLIFSVNSFNWSANISNWFPPCFLIRFRKSQFCVFLPACGLFIYLSIVLAESGGCGSSQARPCFLLCPAQFYKWVEEGGLIDIMRCDVVWGPKYYFLSIPSLLWGGQARSESNGSFLVVGCQI